MAEGQKILIAEREKIAGSYMQKMMEKSGWLTELVDTGSSLLSKLESSQYLAVVISSQLPDMNGVDLARDIRQKYPNQDDLFIIGMANSSLETERKQFEQAGVNYCLTKPVYQKQLVKAIKTSVQRRTSNVSVV